MNNSLYKVFLSTLCKNSNLYMFWKKDKQIVVIPPSDIKMNENKHFELP